MYVEFVVKDMEKEFSKFESLYFHQIQTEFRIGFSQLLGF